MNSELEDLLQRCTVRITVPSHIGWGTGFFVAPGLILTCAHVVENLTLSGKANIQWQHINNFIEAKIEQLIPQADLALLKFTPPSNIYLPCVYLDAFFDPFYKPFDPGDKLYFFGYPEKDFDSGCPTIVICEGGFREEPIENNVQLIKFQLGQVQRGMSGSALFNFRTGKICGMVKFTRDSSFDLGGGAVSTNTVLEKLPQLREAQKQFHFRDQTWNNLLKTTRNEQLPRFEPRNFEVNESLNTYLEVAIQKNPDQVISHLSNTGVLLRQIYLPLKVQELKQEGERDFVHYTKDENIHTWLRKHLIENRDQVIVVKGDSGSGKTTFCEMFADEISRNLGFGFIPIFIRLRDLESIKDELVDSFQPCLKYYDFFTKNNNWLTDSSKKYLVILDGLEDLDLDDEDFQFFIDQILEFQEKTPNQFLITGRSFTFQELEGTFRGVENVILGEIQPMSTSLQRECIRNWALAVDASFEITEKINLFLFGNGVSEDFQEFLTLSEDITKELAGEPLSLCMIAALIVGDDIEEKNLLGSDEIVVRAKIYQESLALTQKEVHKDIQKKKSKENRKKKDQKLLDSIRPEDLNDLLMKAAIYFIQEGCRVVGFPEVNQRFANLKNYDKTIYNLLANFFMRIEGKGKESKFSFKHRDFSNFLFAKFLKQVFLDQISENNNRNNFHEDVYTALGYGFLNLRILRYFVVLSEEDKTLASMPNLFTSFFNEIFKAYWEWCENSYIHSNKKIIGLTEKRNYSLKDENDSKQENCQYIYVGLNLILLLVELYRSAKSRNYFLQFHLCEKGSPDLVRDDERLLRVVGFTYLIRNFQEGDISRQNFVSLLGKHLYNIDLSDAKLQGVDLSKANLRGSNFQRADLSSSILLNADLRDADFSDAILNGCDLRGAKIDRTRLCRASLVGANLTGLNLSKCDTLPDNTSSDKNEADIENLKGINLDSANLTDTTLIGIKFKDAILINLKLDYSDLKNAHLSGANLSNTSFRKANLQGAIFSLDDDGSIDTEEERFEGTDFSGANLQGADFEEIDLSRVDFEGTDLRHANLKNTVLEGALFSGADLSEANLEGAYFGVTDLRGVKLRGAQLEGTILKGLNYNLLAASTFLSHSITDKSLVELVTQQLGRRGVLYWLNKNDLGLDSFEVSLREAIQLRVIIAIFLSEAALETDWCKGELRQVIEADEGCKHILPIYLDDPLKLVNAHDFLQARFVSPNDSFINEPSFLNENTSATSKAKAIADKIAETVYRRSIPDDWSEIAIVLDQRGHGLRRGSPVLPVNFQSVDVPTLTFRPDSGLRRPRETLCGSDWEGMVETMTRALSTAIGTVRGHTRKVRVLGEAQTGLMWAVGRYFDRTTSAELYGYDRNGFEISNRGQPRHTPLIGGNADSAKLVLDTLSMLSSSQTQVALGVGSPRYTNAVQQAVPNLPLFWIESGYIANSEQAMQLVADVVASVERFRDEYGARELVLFWTTANHVALLAAANLTSHVVSRIKFMEWDHSQAKYVYLPMPEDLQLS